MQSNFYFTVNTNFYHLQKSLLPSWKTRTSSFKYMFIFENLPNGTPKNYIRGSLPFLTFFLSLFLLFSFPLSFLSLFLFFPLSFLFLPFLFFLSFFLSLFYSLPPIFSFHPFFSFPLFFCLSHIFFLPLNFVSKIFGGIIEFIHPCPALNKN